MSDASQGPGWWQAADGKWYPPEQHPDYRPPAPPPPPGVYASAGMAPPMDAKGAKAAAKGAKAQAKALRPWYKKKRFILLGIIVLIIVISVAANAGKKTTPGGPAPTGGGSAASGGCASTHPSYPDQQSSHDCVALPNNSIAFANTTVTATWSRSTSQLGTADICAAVTIVNHNSGTINYNDLDWKLQSPSGKVVDTNFEASNDLGSGALVARGTATGNVCFDDPGQSGTYVGIYKPDPFNADRGIWIFTP